MAGPESSGRSAVALSFVSGLTRAGSVCAWVDVSDAFDPESAAAARVDLSRLLWVRCAVSAERAQPSCRFQNSRFLKSISFPRRRRRVCTAEVAAGTRATKSRDSLMRWAACCGRRRLRRAARSRNRRYEPERETFAPPPQPRAPQANLRTRPGKPWARIEQALRVTDLLLQAGGFSAIVLDMAGIAPEYVSRVPLATWFRYRAAAERTQASVLLLTQHPCAKSSGELLLRFQPGRSSADEARYSRGIEHRRGSRAAAVCRAGTMWFRCASRRRARTRHAGAAKRPGQVRDEQACRNLRLRPCHGVSRAGVAAPAAGAARAALRGDGRRAAIAAGLFAQSKSALARHGARHDAGGGGHFSRRHCTAAFARAKRLLRKRRCSNVQADSRRASRTAAKAARFSL